MDDDALLAAFESHTLATFGHREHVRVGFALLVRERDLAAAALAMRNVLRAMGGAKYHETITWAYLAIIAERMQQHAYGDSLELLAANPDLLDHRAGALARHYDVAALTADPLARAAFVLPRR